MNVGRGTLRGWNDGGSKGEVGVDCEEIIIMFGRENVEEEKKQKQKIGEKITTGV